MYTNSEQPNTWLKRPNILNLSNPLLVDKCYECICTVIRSANIEYVELDFQIPFNKIFQKCDSMQLYDEASVSTIQSETFHRYILGLYSLQRRVIEEFPNVAITSSCNNGERFDLGILYYSTQVNISNHSLNNNIYDIADNVKILYNVLSIMPIYSLPMKVNICPYDMVDIKKYDAHNTTFINVCGPYGFGINLNYVDDETAYTQVFREHIYLFKKLSKLILHGNCFRLLNPFDQSCHALQFVDKKKSLSVVICFSLRAGAGRYDNGYIPPRLLLQGLSAGKVYEVTEPLLDNAIPPSVSMRYQPSAIHQLSYHAACLSGDILMCVGLPANFHTHHTIIFYLRGVTE